MGVEFLDVIEIVTRKKTTIPNDLIEYTEYTAYCILVHFSQDLKGLTD